MDTDTYEDTNIDIDSNFNPAVMVDIETSSESANKKAARLQSKQKYFTRQKLDLINEQKSLDRQLNSFSDHWDM
ncbi:hypothetical protein [Colwellia echini]|uniref:BZIP domain-containing protein n=1 Tax=Colwellia echini TaxID=1982103 RepID=A0ABY3MTH3_9GAMM|nr:hypothetical protein [Colwellia echini]TYK64502.1 hypothetical protein CWS31_015135 [Colwellia echini]